MKPRFWRTIDAWRTSVYDRADRPIWQLNEPLFFFSLLLGGVWIMVPARFRTNYASVPRAPIVYWWYGDKCWEEPGLHDFGYTAHGVWVVDFDEATGAWSKPRFIALTREQVDGLFLEGLLVNPKTANGMDYTMHRAVRLFGNSSWEDETNIIQLPELTPWLKPNEVSYPEWDGPLRDIATEIEAP